MNRIVGSDDAAIPAVRSRVALRRLAGAQFANSLGDGAFYVTSALYLTGVVGLVPEELGLGLSLAWGLGFAATPLLGHAADRLGLRPSAVVLASATALALSLLAFAGSLTGVLVAVAMYAVAQSGLAGVRQALLVGLVAPGDRVRVRARLQVTLNAGLGVGATVGGLTLLIGSDAAFRAVLLADAGAFLVAAALLARLPARALRRPARARGVLAVWRDAPFVAATALYGVLLLYMPVLSVVVPLWIGACTVAPTWAVAVLFVLNTGGVVGMQAAAARRVTDLVSAARSVAAGGMLLGGACLVLWTSAIPGSSLTAVALLLLGGLILVTGEVFLAAGAWAIGFGLADPSRPGLWQGFFSSGVPAARAVGPSILIFLILDGSRSGWPALGLTFAAAGLVLARLARRHSQPVGRGAPAAPAR